MGITHSPLKRMQVRPRCWACPVPGTPPGAAQMSSFTTHLLTSQDHRTVMGTIIILTVQRVKLQHKEVVQAGGSGHPGNKEQKRKPSQAVCPHSQTLNFVNMDSSNPKGLWKSYRNTWLIHLLTNQRKKPLAPNRSKVRKYCMISILICTLFP